MCAHVHVHLISVAGGDSLLASGLYFSLQTAQIREGGRGGEGGVSGLRSGGEEWWKERRGMEGAVWSDWRMLVASALIIVCWF